MKTQINKILIAIVVALFSFSGMVIANVATSGTATTSSDIAPGTTGAQAIDGSMISRWESDHVNDGQWLLVELDKTYSLTEIKIFWEGANAEAYSLEVSEDTLAYGWTEVDSFYNKASGTRTDVIALTDDVKFIRVNCYNRNLTYGYSIYELEVSGTPKGSITVLDSIVLSADKTRVSVDEELTISAIGRDQDGYTMATTPIWGSDGGSVTDGVFSSTTTGIFTITATEGSISNDIEIKVGDPQITGTTAQATSGNSPTSAIDDNFVTRWNSDATDTASICINLQKKYDISEVIIHWEAAGAKVYGLDVSNDSLTWTNLDSVTDGAFSNHSDAFDVDFLAQYVRMNAIKRNSPYANSIFEFQVFGTESISTQLQMGSVSPSLVVYPNPVADQLNINSEVLVKNVSIYTINGQLVKSSPIINGSVDVSGLKEGYYITKIDFEDGTQAVSRIVKL